jgi:hypothetical protein
MSPSVSPPTGSAPHPGTLEIWEDSGGGPQTLDPSVCYSAVCQEPIANVYETLVAYNGTQDGTSSASFLPELATCVPGSAECASQYGGQDLVWDNNTTGAPQYYSFEIDAGARFYDATTGTGWAVYPSDVLFSFARTMGWADLPYEEATNGWENTQDLVPKGVPTWDAGIHFPLNNTPGHILSAFLVNDSYYCPVSAVVVTNGCITFNVGASGAAWPEFLNLLANNEGASILPCGWYTYQGAGVPGFSGTNASGGDGPCLLPGNSTNTGQSGFQNYLATVSPTAWDSFESLANNYPDPQPSVQWNDVGSGPYYVDDPVSPTSGYTLAKNPDYSAPIGCFGQSGCLPVAGTYVPNVQVTWESGAVGDQTGLNELAAGQADSAGFFETDLTQVETYSNHYDLLSDVPSLTIGFYPIDLNFSVANELGQDSTGQLNIPGDFFQNVALRQFLVNAYPYATIESLYDTENGTVFGEGYGGALPHDMGGYYPTNISWPAGNPVANPTVAGNVSWWWQQANDASSPYFDPQLTGCTPTTPCRWAMFSATGNSVLDGEFNDWDQEIASLSGGNLTPYYIDVSGIVTEDNLGSSPGQNPMPIYNLGWAPDYPDPTDYMAPMFYPDNSYTAPDAVAESLAEPANNATTCPNDYGAWSNLTYWAGLSGIPTDCQGAAYDTMVAWMDVAAQTSNLPLRTLEYNLVEHIANNLALYVYDPQTEGAIVYGNWLWAPGINTNPILGGAGVQLWFDWGYASNYFDVDFQESGLPSGTSWSVTLGSTTDSTSGSSIQFTSLLNGSYSFSLPPVEGYLSSPDQGTINVTGANVATTISFTALPPPSYPITFRASGLPPATTWSVLLGGSNLSSSNGTLTYPAVANGTYDYTVSSASGYVAPPGVVTVAGQAVNVSVTFVPSYPLTFSESGLPSGATWGVTVAGQLKQSTGAKIVFAEANGSYPYVVTPYGGYHVTPPSGNIVVDGSGTSTPLTFTPIPPTLYAITFSETGLALGSGTANWSISLAGHELTSSTSTAVFNESNSSYLYSVGPVRGYAATPASGNVTVDGLAQLISISFSTLPAPTYAITFEESGLATGTNWSVTLGGVTRASTGLTDAFSEVNGSYSFVVHSVGGYTFSTSAAEVQLAGANQTVLVTFTATSSGTGSNGFLGLSGIDWAVVVVVVLVLAAAGGWLVLRGRRPPADRSPPAVPPESPRP